MSWDGKIYDKYRIEHTDGTPLRGKKYFVLRLDSDDPVEAARVAAAMRAYKSKPRNCDSKRNKSGAYLCVHVGRKNGLDVFEDIPPVKPTRNRKAVAV